MATTVPTSSMAQETRNTSTVGANRAYSNEESGKNECGNGIPSTKGRVCATKPICHGYG